MLCVLCVAQNSKRECARRVACCIEFVGPPARPVLSVGVCLFVCPERVQGWVVGGATAWLTAALGATGSAPAIGV